VVGEGRLPSSLEDMVERREGEKGSTPHHTPEKVAHPWVQQTLSFHHGPHKTRWEVLLGVRLEVG